MKNSLLFILVLGATTVLSSCAVVGGIFKAGVWTGILIVAAIVGLIIFLITRSRDK
jgi:hypothetical protein